MSVFATIALIGVIATTVMTLFLYLIHALEFADLDMLTAIGSYFTRSTRNGFFLGLIVHLVAGITFTFIYMYAASYFGFNTPTEFLMFCSFLGFAHGLAFSFIVVVLVAEHHPLERFRRKGFTVVAAHGLAHIIFGTTIGLTAAWLEPNLESMKIFATGIS